MALGRVLAAGGIRSCFLVGDRDWGLTGEAAAGLAGATVIERRPDAMAHQLAATGAAAVLLHYVNYGYAPRGCPTWLVRGVARWRTGGPRRRLVTYFHEVYACGPPWRSSFWTSPLQRRLAAHLLRASDAAATSLRQYGRILDRWRPSPAAVVAPVFSTVGEPAAVPPLEERHPRSMLVFGSAAIRQRAYGDLREELIAACRGLGIAEVVDMGPRFAAEMPARLDGLRVRVLGALPDAEVSAVLRRSYAGFLGYPAPFLAKSTVYAAYCAHGLVPICAWPWRRRGPPEERPPCWEPGREPAPADPDGLAARAWAWYGDHDLAHQAARLRALLAGPVGENDAVPFADECRLPAARFPATGRTPPPA
ncbi:MAG TPA: glycosyltransferase family 1 protein [Thermoanaerobaculia bacterium]|nr:glycosyltransferase family 1 protein [Thermoanaerobaculia bacterium]